ncbi:hypothetical protein DRW07_11325 [Alteromonas sediminis]|uniref:DUF2189 domain-containing protein n=1 Tax=Alteromonas sediminis TaxID=2259342 RepID=A0A3N5Y148_9ALTE|nr:BPSS1780 family membrane protein [Alteromonas sediminis]RPJ66663.1 hypothetical protein DRW07_11325 [Alteromonas sediminis]
MNNPSQHEQPSVKARTMADALKWVSGGFALFKSDVGTWVKTIVVGFCIMIAMGMIPVLGSVASMLLTYVWIGGLMLGCHAVYEGKSFDIKYLFAGFNTNLLKLVQLSVITGLASLFVMSLVFSPENYEAALNIEQLSQAEAEAFMQDFLVKFLFVMLLMLPLIMASWFAPALIVFHNMSVFSAMRASIDACAKNVMPFLLYGLVTTAMYIAALIPLFLGLLVVLPVIVASIYMSYRDIFLTSDSAHSMSFEA